MSEPADVESMRGVLRRVTAAGLRAGRRIDVVAATKTIWDDRLSMAADAGVTIFGENYAQDFARKHVSYDYLPVKWHFIGHLQRNKARKIVGHADLIQSVDGLELAEHIDRICFKRGIDQNILLQVNIDEDPNKSGILPADLPTLAGEINAVPHVHIKGLMVLPTQSNDDARRDAFRRAKALFDDLHVHLGEPIDTLSMGMSEDWEMAVEEGSTMVRLGTVLFGARS